MAEEQSALVATPLFATRGLRAVADGLVAASLTTLLLSRGYDERSVGLVATATLLGSAATLIAVARLPHVFTPIRVLVGTAVLMTLTGLVFGLVSSLAVLVVVAVIGPLNPTGGDVSAFLPAEQTLITDRVGPDRRTTAFARYSFVGALGGAVGSALAGAVGHVGARAGFRSTDGTALAFVIYSALGVAVSVAYASMRRDPRPAVAGSSQADGRPPSGPPRPSPSRLGPSRRRIYGLTAVFALDSAGGGLVVGALIAAWLHARFDFDLRQVGSVLAAATLASAASALLAPRLIKRLGLVETMVFTHLPANMLLIAAGLAPNAPVAVSLLIARALLSQLDVPARQAFVMTIVEPQERAAAAAFTNLPRSLAGASTPLLGGWLLHVSSVGWPLIIGGVLKAAYDLLLYRQFRHLSTKV